MNTLTERIKKLPSDVINTIKEYTQKKTFIFTNRENYNLYHHLIKKYIKNYDNYIRDMIRRDNGFVFNKIIRDNYQKWCEIKNYRYKNIIFKNYFYFTINYCIENESNNCRNTINSFLKEHGLSKNLHKKNVIKYIRWKD
jgi:hypothetical protein